MYSIPFFFQPILSKQYPTGLIPVHCKRLYPLLELKKNLLFFPYRLPVSSQKGEIVMKIPFLTQIYERFKGHPKYPDHTVESVDLQRYAGKWYEIAAFPSWFEKGCRCSTAEYILKDGYVEVRNTCRKNGKISVATAKAYPVPGTDNSQLKVCFMWPFKGDYWIIGLDEDYQHALVGHPSKKYLWILSRTPEISDETYRTLVETARSKGYDVKKLRSADQLCFP